MASYLERVGQNITALGEYGLMGASAMAAEPIAGLGGLFSASYGQDGADAVNKIREAMTYQPRTEVAQEGLQAAGSVMAPMGEWLGDRSVDIEDMTGIPREAVMAVPQMAAELTPAMMMLKSGLKATSMPDVDSVPNLFNQSGAAKPPRLTRQEAVDQGNRHPIGAGKRLKKPVSEMQPKTEPLGNLSPHAEITPESLQGGVLIPGTGDRSAAGKLLTGIGDVDFPEPVKLEGGHEFMRANPDSTWASDKGVITRLSKAAGEVMEQGKDPYLTFMPMGHGATNFNTMMTDTMLEQIRGGNISKTAKQMFDRKLRKLRPEWKGIDDPGSIAQLHETGALRHAFSQVSNLEDLQRRGFPDMAETRFAITDQGLMDTPLHQGGQSISRITDEVITDPVNPHATYNTQLSGEYVGGIEQGVPRDILFPDFYKARRASGADPRADYRSFDLSKPTQQTTQEWLDGVMEYMGAQSL